jgi:hypothetical protein
MTSLGVVMSNLGIAITITGFFVVQLCILAFLFCMAAENRQIERHQRAIEDARDEAIGLRLDAIFAKLCEAENARK